MGSFNFRIRYMSLDEVLGIVQAKTEHSVRSEEEVLRRFEQKVLKIARSVTDDLALQDDCANAARLALISAARRHQIGRPGFPVYAEQFMTGAASRTARMRSTANEVTGLDPERILGPSDLLEPGVSRTFEPRWLQSLELDERQLTLVCQRYEAELPLADIATTAGTSVSAVSQRLSVIHRKVAAALAA